MKIPKDGSFVLSLKQNYNLDSTLSVYIRGVGTRGTRGAQAPLSTFHPLKIDKMDKIYAHSSFVSHLTKLEHKMLSFNSQIYTSEHVKLVAAKTFQFKM